MIDAPCFITTCRVEIFILKALTKPEFCVLYFLPGVSNRWKSMIGKPIDQSISIDKIS